jgi:uncharacterized HhH-GPD family protein
VEILSVSQLDPFTFRWPEGIESFETGWSFELRAGGRRHRVRHGLGVRDVYGRLRVHTVTWLDGGVQVEGVEADDYPTRRTLISRLRRPGRAFARNLDEVPAGYEGFEIVEHWREIEGRYSPRCLAVKIVEDDLASWALHAWLRSQLPRSPTGAAHFPGAGNSVPTLRVRPLPPPPSADAQAVVDALLAHAQGLALDMSGSTLTPFTREDPFAFLVGVIADMGILAERAWALPSLLRDRLGHFGPRELAANPDAVRAAFHQPPMLHRFVNMIPTWLVKAAQIVVEQYGGNASAIWSDAPAAAELRGRLEAFPGISQKKAAMAVEILSSDFRVPIRDLSGSDVAYEVHLRRVFLRTGLAERDDVNHMVAVARILHPERPGALDNPAWDIGRRWCHPTSPDCSSCPLNVACPRLTYRNARGV